MATRYRVDNHPELSGEDEYHATGQIYAMTKTPCAGMETWTGMEYL